MLIQGRVWSIIITSAVCSAARVSKEVKMRKG